MSLVRKNMRVLFITIISIALIMFVLFTYYIWASSNKLVLNKQQAHVELFSNSVSSFLKSQDSLLEVLGLHLISAHKLPPEPIHDEILDHTMETYPDFLGFGLIAYDGRPLVVSSNFNLKKFPNLMELEQSRDSFITAREGRKMHTGQTYIVKALENKTYAMPIRRAIYIPHNAKKPVAVMTAGIKLDNTPIFEGHSGLKHYHEVEVIRTDKFRQFTSDTRHKDYSKPVSDDFYQTLESRSQPGAYYTVFDYNCCDNTKTFQIVAHFDPYSELWFISKMDKKYILDTFIERFKVSLLVFTLYSFILFILVRSIAKSEKRNREKLFFLAHHDSLTQLPNRVYLRIDTQKWIKSDTPFALFHIDLDNFKSVNDSFGHNFGDNVLIQTTERIKQLTDDKGLLVREASDEFICLWPETEDLSARELADKILKALSQPFIVEDNHFMLGSCIGISQFPAHGRNLNDLLTAADIALRFAKKEMNACYWFTEDMHASHTKRLHLEQRLRSAIKEKRPYMVYQPQVDNQGNIYGVEALVRWIDGELGFVPPDQFIQIAESSGLMPELGMLIINNTLREMSEVQKQTSMTFQISINISVQQFTQNLFVETLLKKIKEYDIPFHFITLEITENLFIEDLEQIKPICTELNRHNIKISLDDFGTGYSSLSMLNQLQFDELKIDKSFVDDIVDNPRSLSMIQNIISIGKNFRISVLAEGVETEEHRSLLKQQGCDLYQGYYFAKPMPKDELITYIQDLS